MNRSVCDLVMMYFPPMENGEGVTLPPDVLTHIETCPHCRAIVDTKTAVLKLMDTVRMDPISERRLQVRIFSRSQVERPAARRVFSRWSAVLTAAASFILLLSIASDFLSGKTPPDAIPGSTKAVGTVPWASVVPKTVQTVEAAAGDKTMVLTQGASLWIKQGTAMEVLADTAQLAKTRVKTGRIVVDIARHPPGFRFVVQTPSAEVEALGTVFSIDVSPNGEETIRVVESAVLVRPKNNGETSVVRAGEQMVLGQSPTAPADELDLQNDLCLVRGTCAPAEDVPLTVQTEADTTSTPQLSHENDPETGLMFWDRVTSALDNGQLDEAERLLKRAPNHLDDERIRLLFKLAAAYRSQRDYRRAVSVYEHLISTYPERDAAVNALVSIGQIKQGFLQDPAGAIFYYDKYLKERPQGILAEAAFAGRVRALFSLRQWQDVLDSSELYLKDFPNGLSRSEMAQKRNQAQKQLDEAI